jgi:hypothetical protein
MNRGAKGDTVRKVCDTCATRKAPLVAEPSKRLSPLS